jgi:hypothetical protein
VGRHSVGLKDSAFVSDRCSDIWFCATPWYVVPCVHGMACPGVADGQYGFWIWMAVRNLRILNTQMRTVDIGLSCSIL